MEKDPALRPRSALEFIGALQAIEQELRLPRTPLELATEESVDATKSRLAPTGDRTQVRAPQVVSPSSTFPSLPGAATPATAAPQDSASRLDIEDLATRRAIAKATPITGYSDGVEGQTLVRGVSGSVPSAGLADDRQPRHGALAVVGVLLVLAIAGIGWYLVGTQQPVRPSAAATVSEQPPEVGAEALPPGQPTVVGERSSGEVTFHWTYPNPAPDDQFEWRVTGTSAVNKTNKPTATVPAPDEGKVCIGVKIYRYDGSNGPSDWTEGCET